MTNSNPSASPRSNVSSTDAQRTAQLLREAEEALAQERLHSFWRDHGKTVLACALMLVIGTAFGNGWRYFTSTQNAKKTNALVSLTSQAPIAAGTQKPAPDIKSMNGTHAALAALILAEQVGSNQKLSDADRREKILATLNQTPQSLKKSNVWGWLVAWSKLRLTLDDPAIKTDVLITDLQKLVTAKKDSPLSALPLIDIALLQGERHNDYNAALSTLAQAEKIGAGATGVLGMVTELQRIYEVAAATAKPSEPVAEDKK